MIDVPTGADLWIFPLAVLGFAVFFGLFPGLILRMAVQFYPPGHPRREELFGELYHSGMGRLERYEWVFQQFETALREGPTLRKRARAERHVDESNNEHDVSDADSADDSRPTSAGELPSLDAQVDGHVRAAEESLVELANGEKFTAGELARNPQKVVLVHGKPGVGKTTLFRGNSSFRFDGSPPDDAYED